MTLTEQQVADVQAMMANVEAAFRENTRARTALSGLLAAGRATCEDVRSYNLATKAVYAYQASVAGIIRASGGDAPTIPPPIYIAWRGVPGDQAVDIDCASTQLRGAGLGAATDGGVFINPTAVEWRAAPTSTDTATVAQAVAAAQQSLATQPTGNAGLGFIPALITIIVYGIIIYVTVKAVTSLIDSIRGVPEKREQTRQMAVQREAHRESLEKRWACYTDCTTRGRDPVECAKACDRLTPGFKPVIPGGGLGLVGTVAGVAIFGLVVYAGWRFVASGGADRRRHAPAGGGGRRALPSHRDEVIDAEFTETAA